MGCEEEAIKVLKLAPENPIVDLWLAHLKPDEKESYITNALNQSPEFVFPHRKETAKVLMTLLAENPDWKMHYYLGLILWNNGLINDAKEEFLACGDNPDFAPFYLAKSKLVNSKIEKLNCLQKALDLSPESWRVALSLANFYISTEQPAEALKLIQPFVKKYPEQSAIGLCYAQSLSAMNNYEDAISFLVKYNVLPFEGATVGRDLYHEACVRSAFSALKDGENSKAIKFAKQAKLWPENLGVGRPYDVDERLEDYILTTAYILKGDKENAATFASKVMNYTHPGFQQESSALYLQLVLLNRNGQDKKADLLLTKFLQKYPESNYMKWIATKIVNDPKSKEIEIAIKQDFEISMPYDTRFKDNRFQLLLDFLDVIEE